MTGAVRSTVQKVIDSSYRPVCWSYSDQRCTLDQSDNTDVAQCVPVIKSRFQAYASSACNEDRPNAPQSLAQDRSRLDSRPIATESSSLGRPSSNVAPAHSNNTQSCPESIITNVARNAVELPRIGMPKASSVGSKRKFVNTGSSEDAPDRLAKQKKQDTELTVATTTWIMEGLDSLRTEDLPNLVKPYEPGIIQSYNGAQACADHLWHLAEKAERVSTTLVWSLKFIAACALLVSATYSSSSTVVQPSNACRNTFHNWRCGAETINRIVDGLLPIWKEKAYLIYHVFAAKGQSLSSVARLSQKRRNAFTSAIVCGLKALPAPSRIDLPPIFDPTKILHGLLPQRSHEDICCAIGLPLAILSDTTEGQGPLAASQSTAYLRQLYKCHLAFIMAPASLSLGDTPAASATAEPELSTDEPESTSILSSTGICEAVNTLNPEEIGNETDTSSNPPSQHILAMDYPWDCTFGVPPTPGPSRDSWATDMTGPGIAGPGMLDFNLQWDSNFAPE